MIKKTNKQKKTIYFAPYNFSHHMVIFRGASSPQFSSAGAKLPERSALAYRSRERDISASRAIRGYFYLKHLVSYFVYGFG